MNKFWVCWIPGRGVPTRCQDEKARAIEEAERLAKKEGVRCHVLELVGYVDKPEIPYKYTEV